MNLNSLLLTYIIMGFHRFALEFVHSGFPEFDTQLGYWGTGFFVGVIFGEVLQGHSLVFVKPRLKSDVR